MSPAGPMRPEVARLETGLAKLGANIDAARAHLRAGRVRAARELIDYVASVLPDLYE